MFSVIKFLKARGCFLVSRHRSMLLHLHMANLSYPADQGAVSKPLARHDPWPALTSKFCPCSAGWCIPRLNVMLAVWHCEWLYSWVQVPALISLFVQVQLSWQEVDISWDFGDTSLLAFIFQKLKRVLFSLQWNVLYIGCASCFCSSTLYFRATGLDLEQWLHIITANIYIC